MLAYEEQKSLTPTEAMLQARWKSGQLLRIRISFLSIFSKSNMCYSMNISNTWTVTKYILKILFKFKNVILLS